MLQYSIRRVLLALPVLFAVIFVTFVLARVIPGDPCRAILGEKATQAVCDQFTRDFGLDEPIPVQFGLYLGQILRGDFGNSIRFGRPITLMLAERLPLTTELGIAAMILAVLLGIPAGIISALRRNSAVDVVTMIGANVGVSMPIFFLGLLLVYFFAVLLRDTPFALPPSGRLSPGVSPTPFFEVFGWEITKDSPNYTFLKYIASHYMFNALITGNFATLWDAIKHMMLPALALSTIPLSIIARMTRSSMLEVLDKEYVRTAYAKGLENRTVIMRHAFRSALLPVVTITGLQLGGVLGGAVLTETIFGLSGVGLSLYEAITSRDFPVIQGFTLVITVIYVFFNLVVDLSYAYLDPRVRLN
ncbi:MAG: ABC transporter permease [Chloroflexi bacterium]|nr:ABC transporter permease [Chloroflexota bacterium]MBP8057944.1 ABC transporter permease [Chloroflexota bacterium]